MNLSERLTLDLPPWAPLDAADEELRALAGRWQRLTQSERASEEHAWTLATTPTSDRSDVAPDVGSRAA